MSSANRKYRGSLFYGMPILIFPTLLTLLAFNSDIPIDTGKLIGIIGFWLIGLLLTLIPVIGYIKVNKNYVENYFLSFRIWKITPSDVQRLEYGNLFRGGLGYGKGLTLTVRVNGKKKKFNIGEKIYGKDAVEDIRKVLEN